MSRVTHAALSLRAVLRNENLRRVELAWGATIGAEWSHFVAPILEPTATGLGDFQATALMFSYHVAALSGSDA